jgi:hypothetical protein
VAKTAGSPGFIVRSASGGRHREWTLALAPTAEARDQAKNRPFIADLAIIRISAASEDAPFTALCVDLFGNGKKKRLYRRYGNDQPNPVWSILAAPAWVRGLAADVTGHGELINAYAGPALGAAYYYEHTIPDGRFQGAEMEIAA